MRYHVCLFIAWLCTVLAIAIVCLSACSERVQLPTVTNLQTAGTRVGTIAGAVGAAATQATSAGQEIVQTAQNGKTLTPADARPVLSPVWDRITGLGQGVMAQGDTLRGIRADLDTLKAQVDRGAKQLSQALLALESEKQARAADNAAWQKKLDAANNAYQRMFHIIAGLALAAIGISIAIGFLVKDYTIAVAGGAGGIAVVVACMIAGQIIVWIPWIAGGLVLVAVLWIGVEAYLRGSLAAALKSNPVQDLTDLGFPLTTTHSTISIGPGH